MKWQSWLKVIIVLIVLILLFSGFMAGYLYGDKSCIENPLAYGLKQLNEVNSDKFTCSCVSQTGKTKPFSFDENKLYDNLNFSLRYNY